MSGGRPAAFEPLNMVERQLVAAANGGVEQRKAFERFILDETLYVGMPEVPAEETVRLSQGETIRLLNVPLDDGRQAAAVFTSPQRVAEAFGEVGYVGMEGRALFEIIRAAPAVLNPGQAYGVVWEPDSLAAMLGLPIEHVVKENTTILLGAPAEPPTALIDSLRAALSAVPQVEAAWLGLAAWPETQSQSWYLDVRTASADHEPIRRALARATDGADMGGRPLDMVINPSGKAEGVGIVVVKPDGDPEPVKKKGLLGRLFG